MAAVAYTCQIIKLCFNINAITAKNTHPPNEPIIPPLRILNVEACLSLKWATLPITAKITGKVDINPLHADPICCDINVTSTIKLVTNIIFTGSSQRAFNGFASTDIFSFVEIIVKPSKIQSETTLATIIFTGKNKVITLNTHQILNAVKSDLSIPNLRDTTK